MAKEDKAEEALGGASLALHGDSSEPSGSSACDSQAPLASPARDETPPAPCASQEDSFEGALSSTSAGSASVFGGGLIRRLPEDVVARIAAGEVITRPSAALKELIENSLDARASRVEVQLGGGGLKLLQISDDGCGVRAEDLELLCARHCTSKLTTVSDLQKIDTFGFRGEALASLSLVSNVSVSTKLRGAPHGLSCTYTNCTMDGEPVPVARSAGTTIRAKNMFYNLETRRRFLASSASHASGGGDDFLRCVALAADYAVQNPHVAFRVQKHQEQRASAPDLVTKAFSLRDAEALLSDLLRRDASQGLEAERSQDSCGSQQPPREDGAAEESDASPLPSTAEVQILRAIERAQGGTRRAVASAFGSRVANSLLEIRLRKPLPPAALQFLEAQGRQRALAENSLRSDEDSETFSASESKGDASQAEAAGDEGLDEKETAPSPLETLAARVAESETGAFHLRPLEGEWRVFGLVSSLQNEDSDARKGHFALFVNDRLVNCPAIKRSVDGVYAQLLPRGAKSWIYLSLDLPTGLVDVNVHPSKSRVQFLQEDFLAEQLAAHLSEKLQESCAARLVSVEAAIKTASSSQPTLSFGGPSSSPASQQSLGASACAEADVDGGVAPRAADASVSSLRSEASNSSSGLPLIEKRAAPKAARSRTDARQLSLTSFWAHQPTAPTPSFRKRSLEELPGPSLPDEGDGAEGEEDAIDLDASPEEEAQPSESVDFHKSSSLAAEGDSGALRCARGGCLTLREEWQGLSSPVKKHPLEHVVALSPERRDSDAWRLRSVRTLLEKCEAEAASDNKALLQHAVYVGAVDAWRAVLQVEESLLLVALPDVVKECVYQSILHRLGRLPVAQVSPPLALKPVFSPANSQSEEQCQSQEGDAEASGDEERGELLERLLQKRALLADYFGVVIRGDGCLHGLPLCSGLTYLPPPPILRRLFLRLATEVNWSDEVECLEAVATCIAEAFTDTPEMGEEDEGDEEEEEEEEQGAEAAQRERADSQEEPQAHAEVAESDVPGSTEQRMAAPSTVRRHFEDVLFPALRFYWQARLPKRLFEDGSVVELTNLPALYRVFERC